MTESRPIPPARDKLLFTPGPLTTSASVKQAMLRDLGSRDAEFIEIVADVRRRLLEIAGVTSESHAAIPMQGSGTFGLESVFASTVGRDAEVIVAVNGAYGRRHVRLAETLGIRAHAVTFQEDRPVEPAAIVAAAREHPRATHVVLTHCETTTGLLNPLEPLARAASGEGRLVFVDAMSSFGGIPIDLGEVPVDFLVSSSNKCVEGVPGFSFVLARLGALAGANGAARSVTMDLVAQHEALERTGQFRFTPPVGVIAAFHRALLELEGEGGVPGRARRYAENHRVLIEGMESLGFRCYLPPELRSHIITTFRYPPAPGFEFERLYGLLSRRGFVIYPGKLTSAECFRVGTIGRVFPSDVEGLVCAMRESLREMRLDLPG